MEAYKNRLYEIIKKKSILYGDFILSSGAKSDYMFDMRRTILYPEGAYLISLMLLHEMKRLDLTSIGGLEMGAVPMASAVTVLSFSEKYPVDGFFIRKEQKSHGNKEIINGNFSNKVLLIDDVATSGNSIWKAFTKIIEISKSNIRPQYAYVVVDREEGAAENLKKHGIELLSFFKKSDFLSTPSVI